MTLRTFWTLLYVLTALTFHAQSVQSGLHIEYGPNLGTSHHDTLGVRHFYVHMTSTITNDSTAPIHLEFELARQYDFPGFCVDNGYKVFLLPESLTPDTATIYNNIVNGQHDYLNAPVEHSKPYNKTLQPGDFCVVTIGVLIRTPAHCAAVPRALFSFDEHTLYRECDRLENDAIRTNSELEIAVKLEYYKDRKFIHPDDGCVVIPCGKITYTK